MIKNLLKTTLFLISILLFSVTSFASSYCGDGILDPEHGEECDDGNFINGDGCSSYCKLEDITPPSVIYVSVNQGAVDISTMTNEFTIKFSEPADPASINKNNIQLKRFIDVLNTDTTLKNNNTEVTIKVNQDLFGESEHSIVVRNIQDVSGNKMPDIFVRKFTTGKFIDHIPPHIIVNPAGGKYNIAQSVSFSAYIDDSTTLDENIDKSAVIYYTLDGSYPSTANTKYTTSISIKENTVLKYFGVDGIGNKTSIKTEIYEFSCAEKPNAKSVTSYPECRVEECIYGYNLINNVCVVSMSDIDGYKANAATAPMFGSDTPMNIHTKPALYITPEHNGLIPRPIIFKDSSRGTIIEFERNTHITKKDGSNFSGYLRPPVNLYIKDYPIHFGYTFKSIFKFGSYDEDELFFNPPYKISVPFGDNFNIGEKVTIFTYSPETKIYHLYDENMVTVNNDDKMVTIIADKSNVFFVAQEGKSFNKNSFLDTAGHWANYYIETLHRMDIVKGKSKGVFAPDDILTRAEFTKIALESIGEKINPYEEIKNAPFDDVPMYAWYVPYIKRAKELGLINGYPDGSFKPDHPINKAEAIKILISAFGFDVESAGVRIDKYRDILTDQWYFPFANFAIKNGLAEGRRLEGGLILDYLFVPAGNITRAEMAKMAVRTIELNEKFIDQ